MWSHRHRDSLFDPRFVALIADYHPIVATQCEGDVVAWTTGYDEFRTKRLSRGLGIHIVKRVPLIGNGLLFAQVARAESLQAPQLRF